MNQSDTAAPSPERAEREPTPMTDERLHAIENTEMSFREARIVNELLDEIRRVRAAPTGEPSPDIAGLLGYDLDALRDYAQAAQAEIDAGWPWVNAADLHFSAGVSQDAALVLEHLTPAVILALLDAYATRAALDRALAGLQARAAEAERERERRRFMQVCGRHLGWGIDPDDMTTPRVVCYVEGEWPYVPEVAGGIATHDGTPASRELAECEAIDRAMAFVEAREHALRPTAPPAREPETPTPETSA